MTISSIMQSSIVRLLISRPVCAVVLATRLLASAILMVSVTLPAYAQSNNIYGNAITGGALFDTALIGGRLYANSFVFPRSGNIVSIKQFFVGPDGGYGHGTGGYVKFELRPDDGSANHLPSSTVLGQTVPVSAQPARTGNFWPTINFTSAIPVTAGVWYHLIAYNTDSQPDVNNVGMDDLWTGSPGIVRDPVLDPHQFAVHYQDGGGPWINRDAFYAVTDFGYSDGSHFGNGYMEVSSTVAGGAKGHLVTGANKVRQVFTVSGGDKVVTSLGVAAVRISGTSPITATLVPSGGGSIIANNIGLVPMGGDPHESYDQRWTAFNLATTLLSGVTYSLEFSAPSDTTYSIHGVRDGDKAGYGWHPDTVFKDGWAEYNTGSGWSLWDSWGSPANDVDLSFYFELAPGFRTKG